VFFIVFGDQRYAKRKAEGSTMCEPSWPVRNIQSILFAAGIAASDQPIRFGGKIEFAAKQLKAVRPSAAAKRQPDAALLRLSRRSPRSNCPAMARRHPLCDGYRSRVYDRKRRVGLVQCAQNRLGLADDDRVALENEHYPKER
jgi:hypothetical protein